MSKSNRRRLSAIDEIRGIKQHPRRDYPIILSIKDDLPGLKKTDPELFARITGVMDSPSFSILMQDMSLVKIWKEDSQIKISFVSDVSEWTEEAEADEMYE